MFTKQDFVTCIRDRLKTRGFKKKRVDDLVNEFNGRFLGYQQQGLDTVKSATLAMQDTFQNISDRTLEAARRTTKMISVQAQNNQRVLQGADANTSLFLFDGKPGNKGVAMARAAVSTIEDDPRFAGLSYSGIKESVRGQLYALFGSSLEKVGKGVFGRQKGKAHLDNIVYEIKGQATGDAAAKEFADAWLKIQDLTVDLFNQAGGSIKRLQRYIPQPQNAVRMTKAGEKAWIDDHMRTVDWNNTRWPDGRMIPPDQRRAVLAETFKTLVSDGASKIDISKFRGRGRAVGNRMENHRFLHYKDAAAWLDIHKKYGDGTVFDTFIRHIEQMSHNIALVEAFGPNPEMTALNMTSIVRKHSAEVGAREQASAEAILKNKFQPMFETVMRQNPMDPNSSMGNLVVGTSNILTAAQLGSASFLAIPGDFMQTVAVRALNRMGLFDGVGYYVKAIAADPKFMRDIATQSGFIMDEVVMSTYSQTRFTGLATYGPAVSRRISEAVMRLSLLSGHTRSARWAVQAEFMGMMQRYRATAFPDLPFSRVMQRYGIDAAQWDAFRNNVQPWTPRKDVNFLRPIDILKSNVPDKQRLYRNFQTMIFDEARKMVPEATIEGATTLKDTTRPDTLVGALLYSFAMYKNFPVSFQMIYGRLGMTAPSVKGRLAFYAGLGAGMVTVGAIGTQLREISKGRDPLPMDNPAFFGKALLSGGALSIWGDFLFTGINDYGKSPKDVVAGPLVEFAGDTADLVLGDVFQWADTVGSLDRDFESTTASKAVEWAKRYTPGTSLWWARLALERQVFDRLQEVADPNTYRKRRARDRRRKREYGNASWWGSGERTPERTPAYGGE